ncbi:hypothetical protein BH13800 [Bartonella henselae str. Houston-1]|uniref:Uncharacterized protein n=1 Tax=Bartonella henselae (strain ATCC 49882 / DSM 28221 / CCUG 30454 / Houston 1) TaxID=283166 RepID=A0A0G2Q8M5_BARHE|nr:hypothetical protein BH12680 [Bartonella henselae str. Houston-1]CAF28145.1 hypothetical protein BH13800 [Bartonella henselae str. Houston-1]
MKISTDYAVHVSLSSFFSCQRTNSSKKTVPKPQKYPTQQKPKFKPKKGKNSLRIW